MWSSYQDRALHRFACCGGRGGFSIIDDGVYRRVYKPFLALNGRKGEERCASHLKPFSKSHLSPFLLCCPFQFVLRFHGFARALITVLFALRNLKLKFQVLG